MLASLSAACFVLVAAAAGAAGASDLAPPSALDVPLGRTSLTLTLAGTTDRMRDGGERVLSGTASLRGSTTLAGSAHRDGDGASAWAIVGGADARTFTTDLGGIDGAARFFRLGLSVGGVYRSTARNTYALHLGVFVAEQETLIGSPSLHPHASFTATHRASDAVTLLYGAAYTYAYGRGLPLPVLGLEWRFRPSWRLDVVLPVATRVVWAARPDLSFAGGLGVAGDLYRFRATDQSIRELHIVRVRLGVSARYAFAAPWHVGAGVGVEGSSIDMGAGSARAYGGYAQVTVGFGSAGIASGALALQ